MLSVTQTIAHVALLAATVHPQLNVTAGPAKTVASPGQTITQKVSNHGTIAEDITITPDEIGRTANGACGFTHPRAPLATTNVSRVHVLPGRFAYISVTLARTGTAGVHNVTVDYTVAGTGNVRVAEGVATQIAVRYPGTPSPAHSAPCIAIADAPRSGLSPVIPAAATAGLLGTGAVLFARRRRARRNASQTA
jgi:hypothetical protein